MTGKMLSLMVCGMAAAAGGSAAAQSPVGPPMLKILPASRDAVVITKADIEKSVAMRTPPAGAPAGAPAGGLGLSTLGAVRTDTDRINVDVIKRLDARAEGPVLHKVVTEIYYILEGGGDFETGGSIPAPMPMLMPSGMPVNPASIGPSLRGDTIVGGTTRHVGPGDIVMIPPNVPHRFVTLDGSVTYAVVRVNPGYEKGK